MNKAELIDAIAERVGLDKRTADRAVEAVLETVTRAVARGERVALTGFGVFEKIDRAARMGRNPQTGERVRVKKTSVPKFRAGSQFKGVVSGAVKLAKETTSAGRATAARGASAAAGRGTAKRTTAKAAPAKKAAAPAKKAAARKTSTPRTAAKKTTAKKSTAKRAAKKR